MPITGGAFLTTKPKSYGSCKQAPDRMTVGRYAGYLPKAFNFDILKDTVTFGVEFYLPIQAGDSLNLPAPGRRAMLNVKPWLGHLCILASLRLYPTGYVSNCTQ